MREASLRRVFPMAGDEYSQYMKESPVLPQPARIPRHLAVIMDGNGRWAKARHLPRVEGHRAGAKTVQMVVEEARRLGVRYLTLYTFSTENWQRPPDEVGALMKLFKHYLDRELERLLRNDIRLRAIGDLGRLPDFVREALHSNMEKTRGLTGMDLILAVSYGGREEILNACRQMAKAAQRGTFEPAELTEETFRRFLYAPDVPDVDLLIRTSEENRISNFLLWQLAYAEIVVSPKLWPEFSKEELYACLDQFSRRNRRFGLTEEQILQDRAKGE